MRIKTKLFLGFGVLLLLLFALAGIGLNRMTRIDHSLNEIYKNQYEKLRLAQTLRADVSFMNKEAADLLLVSDVQMQAKTADSIKKNGELLAKKLELIQNTYEGETEQHIAAEIAEDGSMYLSYNGELMNLVFSGKMKEATQLRTSKGGELHNRLISSIDTMTGHQEGAMNAALRNARIANGETVTFTGYLTLFGLLLGVGVMLWIVMSLSKGLGMVSGMIANYSSQTGKPIFPLKIDTKDEFAEVARIFNRMASQLEETAESERVLSQTSQEQAWLKSNLAQMTTLLQSRQDLKSMSETFIGELCRATGASYGAIYLKEGANNAKKLRLYGTYAHRGESYLKAHESLALGQGLIGQCALDGKSILMNDVHASYINVSSSFGEISPLSLLIGPVHYGDEIVAVFELVTVTPLNELGIELTVQLTDSLGMLLNSIRGRMKVEELLRISQELTEELQIQSEELLSQQNELKASNEMLELQAMKLAVASQYKSEFLANMSHELRTPLNSLLILSQLLAENKDGNLSGKQMEYAETVHASGQELLKLIDDVLDLSKIESGRLELVLEPASVNEIVQSVQRMFQPLADKKGLSFTILLDADVPKKLNTDRQRLMQIIKNLLSNALKFTHSGSVDLHIYRIQQPASMIAFAVKDTGIGIPKGKQSMIFEAFRQADGTTSRRYGGTGLGLSISREFARLLGGEIQLHSQEGEGSLFTLIVPEQAGTVPFEGLQEIAVAEEPPVIQEKSKIPDWGDVANQDTQWLRNKKVMLVDDDIRNLYALSNLLENMGMDVSIAETGKQAIALLDKQVSVDIVFMDLMMPEMDGYNAISVIREQEENHSLPIIALTARSTEEDKVLCLEAGASDYMSKPIQVDELLQMLSKWIS